MRVEKENEMMTIEEATEWYEEYVDENQAELNHPGVGFEKWLEALAVLVGVDVSDINVDLAFGAGQKVER